MNQREIFDYIRNEQQRGVPPGLIAQHLTTAGWKQEDIDKAMSTIERKPDQGSFVHIAPPRKQHWFLRLVALVGISLMLLFIIFSILFDLGYVTSPDALPPLDTSGSSPLPVAAIPVQSPVQNTAPVPVVTPVIPTPASSQPSSVSDDDRDQIILAILTQNSVFSSGSASQIRNYLNITASADPAVDISAMSDAQVLSYAQNAIAGSSSMTAQDLSAPSVLWQQSGATVTLTIPTSSGTVTRTSTEVGGVWY